MVRTLLMKNIEIRTDKYKVPAPVIFVKSGYKFLKKFNWVREVEEGRFHIIQESKNSSRLHFDLIIDGKHSVFDMPFTLKKELKRILKKNYHFLKIKEEPAFKWIKPKKKIKGDTRLRVY